MFVGVGKWVFVGFLLMLGVPGNEQTDQLAKAATARTAPGLRPPPPCPLPCRDLFPTIRSAVDSVRRTEWENVPATNKMSEVTTDAVHPRSYSHIRSRRKETVLARLRTGHTRYTHGFLMSRDVQPFCDDCLVPMTVRQLLVECPSLREQREQYLSQCIDGDGNFSASHAGREGSPPGTRRSGIPGRGGGPPPYIIKAVLYVSFHGLLISFISISHSDVFFIYLFIIMSF